MAIDNGAWHRKAYKYYFPVLLHMPSTRASHLQNTTGDRRSTPAQLQSTPARAIGARSSFSGTHPPWRETPKWKELSEKIMVNRGGTSEDSICLNATLEEALVEIEFGDNRKAVLGAMGAVSKISGKLEIRDLWDSIAALCKLACGEKMDIDVKVEALDLVGEFHKKIGKLVVEQAKKESEFDLEMELGVQKAIPKLGGASVVLQAVADSAKEHRKNRDSGIVEIETLMARSILFLANHANARIAGAAERAVCEIDSPLLREMLVYGVEGEVDENSTTRELAKGARAAGGKIAIEEVERESGLIVDGETAIELMLYSYVMGKG